METVQVGFQINIQINCETEQEILTHLSVIRSNLKKYINRGDVAGEISVVPVHFEDENCYGSHEVNIIADYGMDKH